MPLIRPDWWLSLAAKGNALLGVAGAMLAVGAFSLGLWSTFHTLQTPPDDGLPVMSTLASTWLFCGCILLLGIATYVIALRRRKHLRNTLAALHGNQDALSPAQITGHAEGAQDVTNHALEIVWPSRLFDRPVVARFRATISFVAILALTLAFGLVLAIDVFGVGLDPRWASVSLVFSTAWLWLVGDPWRVFHNTYGIAARTRTDEAGIQWQSILGSGHMMSWSEMCLLEVAKDRRSIQSYGAIRVTIYGAGQMMTWRDSIGPNDSAIRSQQLLDVIATKTRLVPRTGDDTLKRLEGPSRFTSLLSSPAATMQRDQNDPQRRFGDAQYSLVWRNHSPQARLVGGLTGALLIAADAVAVLWILGAVGVRQFDGVPAALPWFNGIWAFFVLLFGIVGVPLLIGALRRERPSWLLADSSGLHLHSFGSTRSISWIAITDVSVQSIGRRRIYSVADAHSPMHFGWNARTRPWEGPSPVPDSVPLTPEEMAELVVERIGKEP